MKQALNLKHWGLFFSFYSFPFLVFTHAHTGILCIQRMMHAQCKVPMHYGEGYKPEWVIPYSLFNSYLHSSTGTSDFNTWQVPLPSLAFYISSWVNTHMPHAQIRLIMKCSMLFSLCCANHIGLFPGCSLQKWDDGPDLLTGIKEYLGAVRNPTYINIIQAEKLS